MTCEITEEYGKLTKHPQGSMRELFAIAFPLMLAILSSNMMMFLDRLILANYSLAAMNAAASAGVVCSVMIYGALGITAIAEVFVAQFNGSKQRKKAAKPTWQMIWFSCLLIGPFYLAAEYFGPYLLGDYHYEDLSLPYYQWTLYFGPCFAAQTALSSFFIGLGKVRLVTIAMIIGNLVNVVFDLILIFGVEGYIPSLGMKGAAIATGIAETTQIVVLMIPFLSHHNNKKYNTRDWSFDKQLFSKCLRIGIPSSLGHMIEITAWAVAMRLMISVSEEHLTIMAVGQSFYSVIAFLMEALQKSVTAITANFIGAKQWDHVEKTWWSAVKLLFVLSGFASIIMILYPGPMIHQFLSQETSVTEHLRLVQMLRTVAILVWTYLIWDGLTWISAGVLTAAGDTFFVMAMSGLSAWLFALMPIYYFIVLDNGTPVTAWMIYNFYGAMNALMFYLRFKQREWRED
jgi:MATE family multidrug resistance protein